MSNIFQHKQILFSEFASGKRTRGEPHHGFSGVLAVRGLPLDFPFHGDPLAMKFVRHNKIAFRVGTESCLSSLECSFCCNYRFIVLDKRFHNESAILAHPFHVDN